MFSLGVASRDCPPVAEQGLLIVVASLVAEDGLWDAQAQQLWHSSLVAPQQVGLSQIRDVPDQVSPALQVDSWHRQADSFPTDPPGKPCRWIPNHWTTSEA